ncbi:MAG TPA: hypothetical protein VFV55_11330 [Usitatibacteraceae bacterium]|nr:hypothetical protein [Usitatibacteraceae bacterium]
MDSPNAAGPPSREISRDGIVIKVTPLHAESVAGFLIGRGFPTREAKRYAEGCVVNVMLRNESGRETIDYDLRSWRTRSDGGTSRRLSTREEFLKQWRAAALPTAALMGFEWSQLPTPLELHAGDSARGMVHTGLAAGSRFDLLLEWKAGGRTHREDAKGIDCAPPS